MANTDESQESQSKNKKPSFWYGVTNPKWVSIKMQYFFSHAAIAVVRPFMVLYYASLGLTTPQIGVIEFVNILVAMISRPGIGTVADKTGRPSLVLGLCIISFAIPMTAMVFFTGQDQYPVTLNSTGTNYLELESCNFKATGYLWNASSLLITPRTIPFDSNRTEGNLVCKKLPVSNFWSTEIDLKFRINSNRSNCSVFLLEFADNRTERSLLSSNESRSFTCTVEFRIEAPDNAMTFFWMILLRSLSALTMGSQSLTESICYDMLGPEHRSLWGQQRMFGTVALAVGAGLMGLVIDYFGTFRICFIAFAALCIPSVLIALFWMPQRLTNRGARGDKKEEGKNVPFCQALKTVFGSPIFCITCVVAMASGLMMSIFPVVWPQHIDQLGAPKLFIGLVVVLVSLFEIPSFFFAGDVVNRIGEPICFILMFLSYAIRFTGNAFLTPGTVWISIPLESLHIFSFSLYFAAATRIAAIIAPPGTSSTVQGLLGTSYGGLGVGPGVLLGSFIYQKYGRRTAFLIYAAFASTGFLLFLIVYFAYLRKAVARLAKLQAKKDAAANEEAKTKKDGEVTTPNDPLMSGDSDEL